MTRPDPGLAGSPIAFLNGRFVAASEMLLSPEDTGFVLGVTLAEQLRTFNGQIFALKEHLERLHRGLTFVGWDLGMTLEELSHAACEVVRHNRVIAPAGGDLGVTIFATPGVYPLYRAGQAGTPTVGIHSYPLPFALWARQYEQGQHLIVSSYRQVTSQQWPAYLKCRSRMHFYLADQEARQIDSSARALLLDQHGNVAETSTANVLGYRRGTGLVSPPLDAILPGVSLQFVRRLADQLSIDFHFRTIARDELWEMDEVMLASTPYCILPVVRIDKRPIGGGVPGQIYRQLLAAWSDRVGVDIAGQAQTANC